MSISSKFISPSLIVALATVAGCATKAVDVDASYVFARCTIKIFTCNQLSAEAERVSNRVQSLTGVQNKKGNQRCGCGLVWR